VVRLRSSGDRRRAAGASGSRRAARTAALALVAGGLAQAGGGIAEQAVQAASDVSDDLFRHPWPADAFVTVAILKAIALVPVVIGLAGLRVTGVAGDGRAARAGLAGAIAGAAVILAAELASIGVRDQVLDDTSAVLVGALFGLGTVLIGAGLTFAGRAAVRAHRWDAGGRARFSPPVSGRCCCSASS
jgi:hypothetical protein